MPATGNFFFIRSTRLENSEVLMLDGRPLWDFCETTFSRINTLCGVDASRIFAEPTVKNQDGGNILNVAWFGAYDDDAKDLESIDRARLARVEDDLIQRLQALRPALADPEIGATVSAMLNLYDQRSIVAVGEHAVLTNWGALPTEAMASPTGFSRHSDTTIGRYLKTDISPRLPGKSWVAHGSIEPVTHAQPARERIQPAQVTPAIAAAAIPVVTKRAPVRWWIPAALAAFFGAILSYVAWPGNLVYEKEALLEQGVLTQLDATNQELAQTIGTLQEELHKDACAIDPTLVGLPARDTAAATSSAASGQEEAK